MTSRRIDPHSLHLHEISAHNIIKYTVSIIYAWRILHSGQTCLDHDLGEQSLNFGNNVLGELSYLSHLTATFFHPYQPLLCCAVFWRCYCLKWLQYTIHQHIQNNWVELKSQYHLKNNCTWLVCFSRQLCPMASLFSFALLFYFSMLWWNIYFTCTCPTRVHNFLFTRF